MERLLMKLENVQNRSYPVIPIEVRKEFSMTDAAYRSEDYIANVSFSELKYDNFRLLYYCIRTTKQNLKERCGTNILKNYPDRICREELMKNLDNLDLSWNAQDLLGCILPNDTKQFALIKTRRFIQQPILH